MAQAWCGSIAVSSQTSLHGNCQDPAHPATRSGLISPDIILSSNSKQSLEIASDTPLQYLSIVDVSKVPLYLALGQPYNVNTASRETQEWFADIVTPRRELDIAQPWWQQALANSPVGVLVAANPSRTTGMQAGPRVTELLFYASRDGNVQRPPTPPTSSPEQGVDGVKHAVPSLSLYALALSSELYHELPELTPPSSPTADGTSTGCVFLPPNQFTRAEIINEPPVRKRKSAADKFDEQTERSKKARHQAANAVSARHSEPTVPTLKHSRSLSGASNYVPVHSRPFSRSPSLSRPTSVRGVSEAPKRSSLSQVQAVPVAPSEEQQSMESRNKELISRTAMAGMRLHGLSQSNNSRKPRPGLPTADIPPESYLETTRRTDEEYKLLYHQVYKGVCFAFRAHIATVALQSYPDAVRETVEKLLAMFCKDPLVAGLCSAVDEYTPSGRKAFGAFAETRVGETTSPSQLFSKRLGEVPTLPSRGEGPSTSKADYHI